MKDEREARIERALERQLLRQFPHLSDGALGYLMDEARTKIEWREFVVAGQDLDLTGLVESVVRSEVGEMIFGRDEAETAAKDDLSDFEGLDRASRITLARQRGMR